MEAAAADLNSHLALLASKADASRDQIRMSFTFGPGVPVVNFAHGGFNRLWDVSRSRWGAPGGWERIPATHPRPGMVVYALRAS